MEFQGALKTGKARLAIAAAAELREVGLADVLSLLLLVADDRPVLYGKAVVRWFAKYAAGDRPACSCATRRSSSVWSTDSAGTTRSRSSGSSGGYAPAATTTADRVA
jgi:hypothetical protein